MDLHSMSPDDRKRLQAVLLQDAGYAKCKRILLWVSLACSISLALLGLMVMRGIIDMTAAIIGITGAAAVYLYTLIRLVKERNAVEARWVAGQNDSRARKKQEKADRKRK